MGFIFSNVRVSTDTDEISFLVDGTPKEYADLEKWRVFEFFLQEAGKETEIQVHVDTYSYGWKRTMYNASPAELESISDFMKADKDFLSKSCTHIGSSDFSFTWSPEELFGQDTEDESPKPIEIHSLAALKCAIKPGTELMATYHDFRQDIVGLVRVVTEVRSVGFYSVIKDRPDHPYSTWNDGKGIFTEFTKAANYQFDGSTIKVMNSRRGGQSVLCEFEVYEPEMEMAEQKEKEASMTMSMGGI